MPRILLIDHDESNCELLTRVLMKKGYEIEWARSDVDALDRLATLLPELILLDLDSPATNGHSLIRILKASAKLANVPILALTASVMSSDIIRARECGFCEVFTKPLNLTQFVEGVEKYRIADQRT